MFQGEQGVTELRPQWGKQDWSGGIGKGGGKGTMERAWIVCLLIGEKGKGGG